MKNLSIKHVIFSASAIVLLSFAASAQHKTAKEKFMHARGEFDVNVIPQNPEEKGGGPFGRMLLDKAFHGDLAGTSKGQMLAAMTAVKGSGGYVALELFEGTLNGKKGTFMLQHSGTMRGEAYNMDINVVPDSGTGELTGISGKFKIVIEGGKHSYDFEYALGEK